MIDPAQSFANALGQGLNVMKSYRDEARQAEQDQFQREALLRAEAKDDQRFEQEKKKWGWEADDRDYFVKTERPLKEREMKARVTSAEVEADFARPTAQANLDQTKAQTANTYDSIRSRRAGDAREAARFNWESQDRQTKRQYERDKGAMLQVMSFLKTGQADWGRTAGTRFTPRFLTGLAGISGDALTAVEMTAKGDFSWMNNKKIANAARGLTSSIGNNVADKFGFARGTVTVDQFLGATKDGRIQFKAVGKDAKTGKMRTQNLAAPSSEVFISNSTLLARSFANINKDKNARAALLGAMRETDEEFFNDAISTFDPKIGSELKALQNQLEKAPAGSKQYTDILARMDAVAMRASGVGLFDRFANMSSGTTVPIQYRAIERVREKEPQRYGNAPTERIVNDMNAFVSGAMSSDANYIKAYKKLYGEKAQPPMDRNRGRLLRDENALWRGIAR